MSIFITNDIYLALPDNTINRPIIGWQSVLIPSSFTASGAEEGSPVSNLWNPDTSSVWKSEPSFSGPNVLYLHNTSGLGVDYLGIAKHNLGSKAIGYKIETSTDNTTWTTLIDYRYPASDGAILEYFNETFAPFFRITFNTSGPNPIIAHVKLGKALLLQRNMYVDHAPPLIAMVDRQNQIGDSGNYLGTIITRTKRRAVINQENNTPEFVRSFIVPFAQHANCTREDDGTAQGPFFFAWRPTTYPTEVIYAWTHDNIAPTNHKSNGMMKWSCNMEAIA